MQRMSRLPLLLLMGGVFVLALPAQQTAPKLASYRPFAYLAPFVPTVSGIPVSAHYVIHVDKALAGGGSEAWRSTTQVARDSHGRIAHELHDYVPASFDNDPPLLALILSDPGRALESHPRPGATDR
ncbi:MAG TPA: hypothetical protein VGJ21_23185 [Terracidiphilus sp.]|jgi:hypothetical protein